MSVPTVAPFARVRAIAVAVAAFACLAAMRTTAVAAWQPADLRPSHSGLEDVLARSALATGTLDARFAQRRERWTYANGAHRLAVRVAVRGADYRVTIPLGEAVYEAGRSQGVPWRGDANGIVHATYSEDQGDALDRVPRALFPLDHADLSLAGETAGPSPAWVIADSPRHDKPHWLYVERSTGAIVREVVREGARTVVTTFDRFERDAGALRPRRWHVEDGTHANAIDVRVDEIVPGIVDERAVAVPRTQHVFAPLGSTANGVISLPARFVGRTIVVDVALDGSKQQMILDTGTASITLDSATARRHGWQPVLEHATVPRMTVGGLGLANVSVLAIPFGPYAGATGILGLDFFFGHVVHVDYANARVDVLEPAIADAVFQDPRNTVIAANVDEGLPLVGASFGKASGERFAIDTGSPHLYVLEPFVRRWSGEIARHWSPAAFPGGASAANVDYLEGSIRVAARRVDAFEFGGVRFRGATVGVEERNGLGNAIAIPLDGIIGTDELQHFDLWFDYDRARVALRRNGR
ncbi:MAG: hypothetical protein NVS3B7_11730 [Candidatus Elarobacter sp.]